MTTRLVRSIAIAIAGALSLQAQPAAPRAQLVIVVDGLRPDYVTEAQMPRLARLGQRGVVFNAHHAVFPTVTRVNGASFATGAYPETHGLLGNTIYIPSVNATRGLDTGAFRNLEAVARAEGRLLTAPTLGELLERAGKSVMAVSSGTTGSAFVLNPTVAGGAIVHHEFARPAALESRLTETLGAAPAHATPNAAQNRRAVDAYLTYGVDELQPAIALLWISDPDTTAHARGIGAAASREALTLVDAEIGRIEDTLRAKGRLERTNILVTSDHGFSTHTAELRLGALVAPFARPLPDGSPDIVVAEGAVHLRATDPARVSAIVAALQRRPEVGAIFTRPASRGGSEGAVPGTLSFDVARWNHARAGDILVSANWTREKNEHGYPGKTADSGVAGHGTSSPFDVHNVLIAAGPDFRERAVSSVPTGNVDLAPTLLRLLRIDVPRTMSGRVLDEAFRDGPAIAAVRTSHLTETVKSADGGYELTVHISTAGSHRYLDYTEVVRR